MEKSVYKRPDIKVLFNQHDDQRISSVLETVRNSLIQHQGDQKVLHVWQHSFWLLMNNLGLGVRCQTKCVNILCDDAITQSLEYKKIYWKYDEYNKKIVGDEHAILITEYLEFMSFVQQMENLRKDSKFSISQYKNHDAQIIDAEYRLLESYFYWLVNADIEIEKKNQLIQEMLLIEGLSDEVRGRIINAQVQIQEKIVQRIDSFLQTYVPKKIGSSSSGGQKKKFTKRRKKNSDSIQKGTTSIEERLQQTIKLIELIEDQEWKIDKLGKVREKFGNNQLGEEEKDILALFEYVEELNVGSNQEESAEKIHEISVKYPGNTTVKYLVAKCFLNIIDAPDENYTFNGKYKILNLIFPILKMGEYILIKRDFFKISDVNTTTINSKAECDNLLEAIKNISTFRKDSGVKFAFDNDLQFAEVKALYNLADRILNSNLSAEDKGNILNKVKALDIGADDIGQGHLYIQAQVLNRIQSLYNSLINNKQAKGKQHKEDIKGAFQEIVSLLKIIEDQNRKTHWTDHLNGFMDGIKAGDKKFAEELESIMKDAHKEWLADNKKKHIMVISATVCVIAISLTCICLDIVAHHTDLLKGVGAVLQKDFFIPLIIASCALGITLATTLVQAFGEQVSSCLTGVTVRNEFADYEKKAPGGSREMFGASDSIRKR